MYKNVKIDLSNSETISADETPKMCDIDMVEI
jgi:hypothetical protein